MKRAKSILKKCEDPYLGLLEHRNTPDIHGYSTSQKLNSRTLRSPLPVRPTQLEPKIVPIGEIIANSVKSKQQNKEQHDRRAKPLPKLSVGDNIRVKIKPSSAKEWSPGTVQQSDSSYIVRCNGKEYRRNRFHIRQTKESLPPALPQEEDDQVLMPEVPQEAAAGAQKQKPQVKPPRDKFKATKPVNIDSNVTRSGRNVKAPGHLKDFIVT